MFEKAKKSILVNIFFLILALLMGYSAFNMINYSFRARNEAKSADEKINELKRKKAELEAYLAELKTPEAAEREAKERLNLKKKGEEVVVVIPKEKGEKLPPPPTFWEKVKSFFGGIFLGQ